VNTPANGEKRSASRFKASPGSVFGKLEQVFDDVYWAWGTVRFMPGAHCPRNMVIIKERGELVVVHPVMMPESEQAKIEALGPIKHVVRLGAFHGMDDRAYVERYAATAWAPPGVNLQPGMKTDRELRPGVELPIAGAKLFSFDSSRTPEMVLHLDRHGGLLLSCDSFQNWETTDGCSFLGGLMARFLGFRGRACIGPGWRRASEPKDGVGFSREFAALLELDFRHAISAHGAPMKETAKADLAAQVRRLYPG
jgi:hypothetical protein